MSTLLGISLFSAMAAMFVDKLYESLMHTGGAAVNIGRYAAFTGTWTAVSTAFGVRKMNKSARKVNVRSTVLRKFTGRTKDK